MEANNNNTSSSLESNTQSSSDPYSSTSDDDYQINNKQNVEKENPDDDSSSSSQSDNEDDSSPSREEQKRIIESLSQELKVGEPAYLVPRDFADQLSNWAEGYYYSRKPVGPINTSDIYDSENRCLKDGKRLESDALAVPKQIWETFKGWYGGEDAPVDVIENPSTKKPVPLAELITIPILYNKDDDDDKVKIHVSKYEKCIDVKRKALKALNIDFVEDSDANEEEIEDKNVKDSESQEEDNNKKEGDSESDSQKEEEIEDKNVKDSDSESQKEEGVECKYVKIADSQKEEEIEDSESDSQKEENNNKEEEIEDKNIKDPESQKEENNNNKEENESDSQKEEVEDKNSKDPESQKEEDSESDSQKEENNNKEEEIEDKNIKESESPKEDNNNNKEDNESDSQKEEDSESDSQKEKSTKHEEDEEIHDRNKEAKPKVKKLSDFKLYDYYGKYLRDELKDGILDDFNIINNNALLVDHKDEDGNWYSDSLKDSSTSYNWNSCGTTNYSSTSNDTSSYYYGGSYGQPLGPGKVGFQNLGNTCFFNSGVQCLMHSKPLVTELLKDNWDDDINVTNPLGMKGRLATAFHSLLKKVWEGTSRYIAPDELKSVVGEFASQFSGWGQQDSHELITFMLDGIHEDLNRCRTKPLVDTVIGDGTNDLETAEIAWENHKKRNDSIIIEHFHGQLKSRLYCPQCGKVTVVFDPFMTLSLPITQPRVKNIAIRFVPADFTKPLVGLKIVVPSEAKTSDYAKAISQSLGREVNVVLASISSYGNKFQLGIVDGTTYSKPAYFAYEITDANKIYVPCCVKANLKDRYYQNYNRYEEIGTPFLLPVSKENTIEDKNSSDLDDEKKEILIKNARKELEESAAEMLKCCWNPSDSPEVTDSVSEKAELIIENEKDKVEEGHKFGVDIEPIGYMSYNVNNSPLVISSDDPHATENIVSIYIADEERTEEKGFSLASLMRHVKEFERNDNSESDDDESSVTLDQCFGFFSAEEVLDEDNQWYCPHCKSFVCARKKMDLWKAPQCFVIHLKRFTPGQYTTYKDERFVDFPDEIDLNEFIVGPKEGVSTKYRLYGVDEHMGNMSGGHYTAECLVSQQGSNKGEWYSFNDSSCSETSAAAIHTASAYVLFYQRIDEECPVVTNEVDSDN